MESNTVEFKCNNPGVVLLGNFINYYKFHPPENRINLFPKHIWKSIDDDFTCLDVGCNSGELTVKMYEFLRDNLIFCESSTNLSSCNILGIDVDPTLILRAKEINKYPENISFQTVDVMNDAQMEIVKKYLILHHKTNFNVSFCLSITMWIHLNCGDDGLRTFLSNICKVSQMVVIEPQPWKCYKTAVKRLKQANEEFAFFKQLKYRQNCEQFVEDILIDCKFSKIFETECTSWGRRILFYVRNS